MAPKLRGAVKALAFLPPGRLLIGCGARVRAWDYRSDALEDRPGVWSGWLDHIEASDDGRIYVARSDDGMIALHAGDGRPWPDWPAEPVGQAVAVALARDGSRVATLTRPHRESPSRHARLSVRDTAGGALVATLLHDIDTLAGPITFNGDGSFLAASIVFGHALIWEVGSSRPPIEEGYLSTCSASPAQWHSPRPQREPLRYGSTGRALALAFSADGAFLASEARTRALVWDVALAERRCTLAHGVAVKAVAFPPAGPSLATVAADGALRLWDWQARGHPQRLRVECGLGPLQALAFSPDGQLVAVGGKKGCGLIELDERILT